jgi:hypothetical protein
LVGSINSFAKKVHVFNLIRFPRASATKKKRLKKSTPRLQILRYRRYLDVQLRVLLPQLGDRLRRRLLLVLQLIHLALQVVPLAAVFENLFFSVIGKQVKYARAGNTKGGSITVPLTSCLTGLESAV